MHGLVYGVFFGSFGRRPRAPAGVGRRQPRQSVRLPTVETGSKNTSCRSGADAHDASKLFFRAGGSVGCSEKK